MNPQQTMPAPGSSDNPVLSLTDQSLVGQTETGSAVLYANQPLSTQASPQTASLPSVSAPAMADDVDLIEKEWVNKISEIIQKTKGDPYERARQLAVLKSEYLQKRYQKTIKLT